MEKRRPTDDAKRTGSGQKRRNPPRGRRGRAAPTFFRYGHDHKRSWAIPGMGVLELTAEYEVELPVPVFHIPVLHYKEKLRMKTWTGYVKTYEAGIGDNELVYVTETGIVYHRNYQCTYLEPSVRSVAKTQLGELRNSSGGIYHLCERCGWMPGNDGNCYVTDYGDRYHTSLSCSGLKRKVYTVPLSEVKGKGACSKCGGK